jgi:hypothetical protein
MACIIWVLMIIFIDALSCIQRKKETKEQTDCSSPGVVLGVKLDLLDSSPQLSGLGPYS